MNYFRCPVCDKELNDFCGSLRCESGHCFDRAKSGYVNLLLTGKKNHGDDRLMVRARSAFLSRGFYRPLLDGVCDMLVRYNPEGLLLDAGCGEGYYTRGISEKSRSLNLNIDIIAVDISKNAVDAAARKKCALDYAVASVYDLPFFDSTFDAVLNIFAPFCSGEYRRVLKNEGTLVYVIPLENHLLGLKRLIYDKPYTNEIKPDETEGFRLLDTCDIKYKITLESNSDIMNLFMMTPYYYTTGAADQSKIKNSANLETEAEFRIFVYKRI
jgi:23S rRNA (guanine745-N1)-methyltransferase